MPYHLEPIPEDETIEMIVRYSLIDEIPVTEHTIHLIAQLSEGNPFYISALFRSRCPEKDLMTPEGVLATLEFETLHKDGDIRGTWLDYINAAFPQIKLEAGGEGNPSILLPFSPILTHVPGNHVAV